MKNDNLLLIGAGLVLAYLASKKDKVAGIYGARTFNLDALATQIALYREYPKSKIQITEILDNGQIPVLYFKIIGEKGNYLHTYELTKTGKIAKNSYFRLIDWD